MDEQRPNTLLGSNGVRLTIRIGGILAAIVLIFTAGVNWQQISGHVSDVDIHQSVGAKQALVDARVGLLLTDKLDAFERRLESIEKKLDKCKHHGG